MPIIATASTTLPILTAINPIAGCALAGLGVFVFFAKKHQTKSEKKSTQTLPVVKQTYATAHQVNFEIEKNQKIEKKQRQFIEVQTKKEKENTQKMTSCTRNLKETTHHLQIQANIAQQKLQDLERLQEKLALTQQKLHATQQKLDLREQEMAALESKYSAANLKFGEAVQKNTKLSTDLISEALSIQKTHQETVTPLLESKDTKITELTNEVLGLRRTLREINHRITNTQQTSQPEKTARLRLSENNSLFSTQTEDEKNKLTQNFTVGAYK